MSKHGNKQRDRLDLKNQGEIYLKGCYTQLSGFPLFHVPLKAQEIKNLELNVHNFLAEIFEI